MRKAINMLIRPLGISIEKLKKIKRAQNPLMENVFNTSYERKVLLSYITEPFINKLNFEHTNMLECYTSAEIFRDLGYNIDVIDFYNICNDIELSEYAIIFGMGNAFTQTLGCTEQGEKPFTMLYGACASESYVRAVISKKMLDFFQRTGKRILSSYRPSNVSVEHVMFSDHVIVLGNDFTLNTYHLDGVNGTAQSLRAFYYDTYDIDLDKKNFEDTKTHVLWFGSGGLLHKGLDLAIDSIKQLPGLTLHICGANSGEKEFFEYYSDALNNRIPNIINHGFIKMDKPEFRRIMDQCGCVLFPSLSEGGSPSLLNVIANGGLIPITSDASGVDTNGFGVRIEELSLEGVQDSLEKYLALSTSEIAQRSKLAKSSIRDNYSYDKYHLTLRKYITTAMENLGKN